MKIWPWGANPDYSIAVQQGSKGKWRWMLRYRGDAVALSPVKGWDDADEARAACHELLDGIGAVHIREEQQEAQHG